MKNRYLFRAKRIDNGEWTYGDLVHSVYKKDDTCVGQYGVGMHTVDLATVCQCTGLVDKNGKLIWENDIVKDNIIYGVVKWENTNVRYIIDDRDDGYQDYSEWWHEVKVIGNAFDNPELLEA